MAKLNLKTTKEAIPQIYSYSTPEIKRHDGWTKIGYTEQEVEKRIDQQTHTADVEYQLEWQGNAVFEGTNEVFSDKSFHAYLRKNNIEEMPGKDNEWFHIDGPNGKLKFYEFRENRGILELLDAVIPYTLRDEQEEAIRKTIAYYNSHENGEFLWNAKPRFGKTLAAYDLAKRIGAKTVLIVTNRPAIANSWYDDYVRFMGDESGFKFISHVDGLKDKPYVLTNTEYTGKPLLEGFGRIEFVSLQDLKGSIHFGGPYEKLEEVKNIVWDLLIIDEAHEGVDTYKTDIAFNRIRRKFTLHLSGTPFKALANDKFSSDAIFNWTYADEQERKESWDNNEQNPYYALPKLNMLTYQMSEIVKADIKQGIEINGETEEYAFDLNEFFLTNGYGKFYYESSVDRFLDALTTQTKFPFSTPELRDEIKHSFWLLNRVDSAKALAKKLREHPVFKDYEIILAAGDGKIDDDTENKKSFDKVKNAIAKYDKTITLSVGQLTTGVTIPEWTAVLMLSNVKSPSLYMQAAFRAQNPCLFSENGKHYRKENAYVFDFDPARTLNIFEEFANDLYSDTASGKGTAQTRKDNIKRLLNFFPVLAEDENGEMIELNAEKVMTIPRKIKSVEVVRRGFMSNFLFQNINNIFNAPKEVIDILNKLEATSEPDPIPITQATAEDLHIDENGDINITEDTIIKQQNEIFGPKKIYETIEEAVETFNDTKEEKEASAFDNIKKTLKEEAISKIVDDVDKYLDNALKPSEKKRLTSELNKSAERKLNQIADEHEIKTKELDFERIQALQNPNRRTEDIQRIQEEYQRKIEKENRNYKENITKAVDELVDESTKKAIEYTQTKKVEKEKNGIEESVRDHLRGFSRTIPSFLMAYGDDTVTLATFDEKVPGSVFMEVTSITLDQFKFLRDGGEYIDEEAGEKKHFNGNLFDPIVFDDSVKEFLRLKKKLADYFDEKAIEDIFDYIPPQRTNQIYTPKDVAKRMVDMLEKENPGCFDEPDKTFIDLYMKSGLYITEIVKRLYQSNKMKERFPDGKERLKHIFANQVYGLAPTEIIYKIATSYILGFDEDLEIKKHNFRQVDALPYAKAGTLSQLLDELYENN